MSRLVDRVGRGGKEGTPFAVYEATGTAIGAPKGTAKSQAGVVIDGALYPLDGEPPIGRRGTT